MNDNFKEINLRFTEKIKKYYSIYGIYIFYIILIILFSILVTFVRPYVAGVDTYYYMNHSCHGSEIEKPILSTFVFGLIPCNDYIWKLLQIGLFIISIALIGYIGKQFNNKYGYLASLFAFLGISLQYEFLGNLEPQQLALPILFVSLLFLIKYINSDREKFSYILYSFLSTIIACMFWDGSYLFFIFYILLFPILLIPSSILIGLNPSFLYTMYSRLVPNFTVYENLPIIAIIYWIFLLVGIPQMIKIKGKIKLIFIVLLIVGLFNAKYSILVVPLLSVGVMIYFSDNLNNIKKYAKVVSLLFFIPIIFLFSIIGIYHAMPNSNIMNDLNIAKQYSIDNNYLYENDWGLGYFSEYLGYNIKYKGSNYKDYNYSNSIVITIPESNIDIDVNNICEKLDITNYLNSYYCK